MTGGKALYRRSLSVTYVFTRIKFSLFFISICIFSTVAFADGITPSPAFQAGDLAEFPRENWITNGGNLANQRYSPLKQVNRDNVTDLKAVWRAALNSGLGPSHNNQAQPLVYAGVLYLITGADDVFAIDIDTGKILWTYKANLDPEDVLVCCGWVSRGVGIGEGKVFAGQLDGELVALDQKTGTVIWSTRIDKPHVGYSITAAPLYYNGMVIVGNAGGDMGTRGRVSAYDAKDGSQVWTFYTIPGPGEPGHDTWSQDNDNWKYGGAPVWHTPAIDPELGMIYFGTGNPAPDLGARVRIGDNLYSDSIVALDVATGKLRWYFQEVHHDLWDYDAANPVILFDARFDGKMRKGLAHAGKTGWVYLLDRETGEPLIGIEERPVPQEPSQATVATQPYPIGDALVPQYIDIPPENFTLVNQGRIFTPFGDETGIYKPMAAVNWPPSSYDPETNLMYICANDVASGAMANDTQFKGPTFERHFFGGMWNHPTIARRGIFTALDVRTNRIKWNRQWGNRCRSGSLVTAGGLVFVGRIDGRLTALDKADGSVLWEFRTEAGINTAVTSFEYKGDQYIATYSGGAYMDGGPRGDGVWLFSLKGSLKPLPPPPSRFNPARAVTIPEGRSADIENGRQIFMQSCQYCHGADGEGGQGGGAQLTTTTLGLQEIMNVLGTGRNAMPAFSTVLSAEEIHDTGSFIIEQLVNK